MEFVFRALDNSVSLTDVYNLLILILYLGIAYGLVRFAIWLFFGRRF